MIEILGLLGDGFLLAMQPLNLALIFVGVTLGLFIGAMPGLGSVNGVTILLPITFLVPPASAIIFLAAIYYGSMYGGAISSITLTGSDIWNAGSETEDPLHAAFLEIGTNSLRDNQNGVVTRDFDLASTSATTVAKWASQHAATRAPPLTQWRGKPNRMDRSNRQVAPLSLR